MTKPENGSPGAENQNQWDSLNSDVVEVTEGEVDYTVRPMRESLRKRLKPPPKFPVPPEPRQENQSP
jgi:hypothetical protein